MESRPTMAAPPPYLFARMAADDYDSNGNEIFDDYDEEEEEEEEEEGGEFEVRISKLYMINPANYYVVGVTCMV